ncbi:beta-glucosidase BglX [Anaerosporobacter sp.]|uniref:beta-glucosidase BglX n=1 Tax=Anaerosporobacter sp. TaxID=1872529 RepID=UPI00286F1E60|nr:beta-glucosidase BglX [Anaerosporobacter sp.]
MKQQELINLVKEMSLSEKVNQLLQVTSGFYTEEAILTGPIRENGITEESVATAGTVIGLLGAEKYREVQDAYIEKHPHKIPLLFMLDVINGFRTIFPIPLGQGATFEPELSKRLAQIAAKESAVSGIHVTFAPMVDLVRDARWGRVMESTGEDGKLNSDFAKAMVEGFQGDDVGKQYSIGACVKHFAAYGAPTAGREYNTVELSENTLRCYYLPAYKAAIDAGVEMVMTSFNTLNGVPSTGNEWLMGDVLRDEMGFDGVLISDWAAIEELIYHGYAKNREQAGELAIKAGVDIDMMTGIYSKELLALIESGKVDESLVDESVLRILTLKNKLGLFENPYKDADPIKEKEVILCEEHRKVALEAAVKSFVLLENDGILPLKEGEKIAFIGPFVSEKEIYGAWSMMGREEDSVSIVDAFAKYKDCYTMTFVQGAPILGAEEYKLIPKNCVKEVSKAEEDQMLAEAIEAAKGADKVILAIGEHRLMSGEAASRTDLLLPEVQQRLLRAVYEVNPNIAVVLFTGRPLDLREVSEKSKAILTVWMPGTEGGNAIANVLTGDFNPSGKLPMSFPYCVGQVPVHYNEYFTGRPFDKKSGEVMYRSNYRDVPNDPLYPFGYGLSYTTFAYSNLTLSKEEMTADEQITASVTLKNTGDCIGTETVQLYVRDCFGSVVRPRKELKDYQKVTLQVGEEQVISFSINEEMLTFCRADMSFGSEPGEFYVYIGADSSTEEYAAFELR